MKKLKLFSLLLLALSALFFVSCKDDDDKNTGDIIEDGFYVYGDATAYSTLNAKALMSVGYNEADGNNERSGMYEKYIALEANKPFSLLLKRGVAETKYGATLANDSLKGESEQPDIVVKKGQLQENMEMQVTESGLYHVVLDLNTAGDLSFPQIVLAPVTWGMRGDINGWGFTEMTASAFNKETMTFTVENVQIKSSQKFKFAYGGGWKIQLDEAGKVKANTNLGKDDSEGAAATALKAGAGDITLAESGFYTVKLTWKLDQGTVGKGYTVEYTKTGNVEATDYSNCELELVGSGVDASNPGATPDGSSWNWGNVLPAGKPTVNGTTNTWTWESVALVVDGFKIRTLNGEASGGVATFDMGHDAIDATASSPEALGGTAGSDMKVTVAGNYKIVLTIDGESDTRKVVITKL